MKPLKIYSQTDRGQVRSENQDAYIAATLTDQAAFAVVCDGMGGANAGNIASQNAVKIISDYILRSFREDMSADDLDKLLRNAITSANMVLYDMSIHTEAYAGMGTTVAAAIVCGQTVVIAHVGDSRIYLAGCKLIQLTRDHSVVQSLLESGKITKEDAKVHPRKNIITRALGAEETVAVDTDILSFKEEESLLLCTDGLTNYLEPGDILEVFKTVTAECVPDRLVDLANAHGGGDNITVVTINS